MDYTFTADLLNKFSQLTPWVQAITALGFFATCTACAYLCKQTLCFLAAALTRPRPCPQKQANAPSPPLNGS